MKKRCLSIILTICMLFSLTQSALAYNSLDDTTLVNNDSVTPISLYNDDGSLTKNYFDSQGNLNFSVRTFESNNNRTVFYDDGKNAFKVVSNDSNDGFSMYLKPSGALDSEYKLYMNYEPRENIAPYKYSVDYRHGTFFEFDYYQYNDNSYDLFINHSSVEAAPGKFTSQVNKFKSSSIAADNHFKSGLINAGIIMLPNEVGLVTSLGKAVYDGWKSGEASDTIAGALIAAVEYLAGYVTKSTVAISLILDGINVYNDCNAVQAAWDKVRAG